MLAQIQFLRMSRSESVESYINNQLEDLSETIPSKKTRFRVWVECLNSQIQPGKDMFRCAIEVEGLKRKHYFAEKRDGNFYLSVDQCVDAVRKMFRREKKISRSYQKTTRHEQARRVEELQKLEVQIAKVEEAAS